MISSLRTRLLLAVGVLAVTAIVAVALSARQTTRVEFQRLEEAEQRTGPGDDGAMIDGVATALDGKCCDETAIARAAAALGQGRAFLVVDEAGKVRAARGFGTAAKPDDIRATFNDGVLRVNEVPAAPGVLAPGRQASPAVSEGLALVIRGAPTRSIALADGARATLHVMRVPDRMEPAAHFLGVVDRRLLATTALVAVLALAAAWVISGRMVKPIAELRDAARDLGRGDLSRRVSASGADELAGLARSFNAMAAELQRQEGLRRGLVHDVAHELRTPLTALRCRIETAIDGLGGDPRPALAQMNEEVAHLSQLVSDLEDLARAEAGDIHLSIVRVGVADLCASAIRAAGLEHDARVAIVAPADLAASADAVRMRQIVVNLLTNAERHTPADGRITLIATARQGEMVLEVHNTGSALTPREIERVFDRFYRADPSRQRATGGRGLGLAIVKHLTEAQHGRVWASSDATGVTVSVALPSAPQWQQVHRPSCQIGNEDA